MTIFSEMFDILDEPNFAQNFPEQHFREVARIRALKNSIDNGKHYFATHCRKCADKNASLILGKTD